MQGRERTEHDHERSASASAVPAGTYMEWSPAAADDFSHALHAGMVCRPSVYAVEAIFIVVQPHCCRIEAWGTCSLLREKVVVLMC